jgi:hypothetical protein
MIPVTEQPPNITRPLQFVSSFEQWCGMSEDTMRLGFQSLLDCGVSGLVTTVSLEKYLSDDTAWDILRRGVRLAHAMGLRVWIYDEKGYPSGTAGGLVLANMPDGEAEGLLRAFDPLGQPRYEVGKLFEGTHATANFFERRHYINILDRDAVAKFVEITHDRYERALHPIGEYVEAFFTDEPSLISTYVPAGLDYPRTLPWHRDLPKIFRDRKGYDVTQHWESLFVDTGAIDRKIRCDFYEVIADLCAETYFGQLQAWCRAHNVSSSGHLLGEETLVWQTDFDGDPFTCYRKFDIPGIDMILSNPERIMQDREPFFLVPKVAGSAARLQGKRRVMCEISDFFGLMGGHHATLEQMKSTAGILMSLGITDFVSMYTVSLHKGEAADPSLKARRYSAEEFRTYTDYVDRVNRVFAGGERLARVAVLHPIVSVWAHFTPSDRSMYEPHPSELVRFIDDGFASLCRYLLQQQIGYDIIDERSLATSRIENGKLVLRDYTYEVLVLPPMDTVRTSSMEKIVQYAGQGGAVFTHALMPKYAAEGIEYDEKVKEMMEGAITKGGSCVGSDGSAPLSYLIRSRVEPSCTLFPASPHILCTTVVGTKGKTYFLVNTSSKEYKGECILDSVGQPLFSDPANGRVLEEACEGIEGETSRMTLDLPPFASRMITFG